MIIDRYDYETMTPHCLLARIQQHESDEKPLNLVSKDPHALVANTQGKGKGIEIKIRSSTK